MSIQNYSKEFSTATRNPTTTDRTDFAQTTDDRALTIRRYRNGDRPDEIADALEAALETVSGYLRDANVLAPWDDYRALAHLYHDYGYDTLDKLAALFNYERSTEVIRSRMDKLGVDRGATSTDLLESLNPEDVGLSPLRDADEYPTPDEGGQQTLDAFGGGSE
ncbi:hypothetical protein [Natrinema salifodinae]|uniref:Helix-turn-helix domain-containing protein n=2 Tax=Halobacteriales TaxID=2235 RepID=A0A1I0QYQ3_9EURY|nr:hypothetical protein [Natrinema salifodinae]SEW32771.1 hypothetical protein SAMN05216285_4143 [Natrinema salifodinae]